MKPPFGPEKGQWYPGPASSSFSSTPTEEEVKYPLHEMIAPSLERIEAFLSDEKKEKEQASAKNVLTMSRAHAFARQ